MYKTLLLLLAFCFGGLLQAADKPNIVYIMSDELAYFELSHMGNKYIETPNIDRMAAEGIRFTQALAGAPVCAGHLDAIDVTQLDGGEAIDDLTDFVGRNVF